jgi:hypothetical protein
MKRSEAIKLINNVIIGGYDYPAETILQKLEDVGMFNLKYINPKFKGVSGKGDSWDYLHFCSDYPEHYFTHKNPRPEFYINGWEPEDE